jgi:hypothetical protein
MDKRPIFAVRQLSMERGCLAERREGLQLQRVAYRSLAEAAAGAREGATEVVLVAERFHLMEL